MHRFVIPALAILLAACGDKDDSGTPVVDDDQDGFAVEDDCDDANADVNPGMDEEPYNGLDDDCDEGTPDDDLDADGFGIDEDCDDGSASINPDAEEVCDGVDNDCDDDVDGGATDASSWYFDGDADGFGGDDMVQACEQPSHYVDNGDDCNDGNTSIHPDADEECDGVDNDCDDEIDEDDAVDAASWHDDADGDGYGDPHSATVSCEQPSATVPEDVATDCDDSDDSIYPGADEYCDEIDHDCDGTSDDADAVDASSWYADADGDGYGDARTTGTACEQPSGYVADATDCDDGSASVYPGAPEYCDTVDHDCDGTADDADALDADTWYRDGDSDGYGDSSSATTACSQPTGYVSDSTDCDDRDDDINPGADEYCNEEDDDCDGHVDEDSAVDAPTWYVDMDGDGYGSDDFTTTACDQPTGFEDDADDCDDTDATVNPDAVEVYNGADDDCNGKVDDNLVEDCSNGSDDDGDGHIDCEDSDCVRECLEDCTDGVDNDADGDIDCDDDECYGLAGCEGPYTVSLTTDIGAFGWLFGNDAQGYWGLDAVAFLYSDVSVYATPDGWSGSSFTCDGEVYGVSWYGSYGYLGFTLDGSSASMDYVWGWEPTEANHGLTWDRPCQVTGLPLAYLGTNSYVPDRLYRRDSSGGWFTQYIAAYYSTDDDMPGSYVTYMYSMSPVYTLSWTGYY